MEDLITINSDEILNHIETLSSKNVNIFKSCSQQEYLSCYIFFLEDNNLINYKKYEIQINNNLLMKKELMTIVLNNQKLHNKLFKLTGIYKYEINIKENEIRNFCENSIDYDFISKYTSIEDIHFNPNIEIFSDNNSILLFFSRKVKNSILKNNTNDDNSENNKDIYSSTHNKTKKVRFKKDTTKTISHNKTIRKQT